VLHKRASDLLDPFVGGTEQNIAGAFTEARDTHAFLVFDEADSLLLERARAVRGWVSQVTKC
jgi:transitional endoplasmic reticulum ATPase